LAAVLVLAKAVTAVMEDLAAEHLMEHKMVEA
jgi:hypothetical protein